MRINPWFLLSLLLPTLACAESWSIRISEDEVSKTYGHHEVESTQKVPLLESPPKSEKNTKVTYVNRDFTRQLNPSSDDQDAKALGSSIEFEVFQINESKSSHTIFESGAGICQGFHSRLGVEVTDATTYYVIPVNKEEYYTNIATATVLSNEDSKNMQYVPVFYIQNPELAKKVQDEENKKGKNLASKNIENRKTILSHVICRKVI
ncbi:hypothetical protein ACNO7P_00795 [Bisgaard Taxon 45]